MLFPGQDTRLMSAEGWLQTRRLSKHFGAVVALHDLNLRIKLGEVVALVGDNGAGKSTLVKLLSGAHLPSSGEIAIGDRVVSIDSPGRARSF
jgi:D-xylose transport system ATP-binding protein